MRKRNEIRRKEEKIKEWKWLEFNRAPNSLKNPEIVKLLLYYKIIPFITHSQLNNFTNKIRVAFRTLYEQYLVS